MMNTNRHKIKINKEIPAPRRAAHPDGLKELLFLIFTDIV